MAFSAGLLLVRGNNGAGRRGAGDAASVAPVGGSIAGAGGSGAETGARRAEANSSRRAVAVWRCHHGGWCPEPARDVRGIGYVVAYDGCRPDGPDRDRSRDDRVPALPAAATTDRAADAAGCSAAAADRQVPGR